MWDRFFRKSIWSFSSISAKTICILVINKIFAVFWGTTGITLLAHFQNLLALVTHIPNDGINRGVVKFWANKKIPFSLKLDLFFTGFVLNGLIFGVSIIVFLLFHRQIFSIFLVDIEGPLFIGVFIVIVFLNLGYLFFSSIILSFNRIKSYTILNIASNIFSVAGVIYGAIMRNFDFALLAYGLGMGINIIFTTIILFRLGFTGFPKFRITWKSIHRLSEFIVLASSVLIFGKLVDFLIRLYAIQELGFHRTGLWQAIVRISEAYMFIFIGTLGMVYRPNIQKYIFDYEKLSNYVKYILKISIPFTIAGLVITYFLRNPILSILFSPQFIQASRLMPFQLIGDFFGIIAYLLAYVLAAQSRIRDFILLQAMAAISFVILTMVFINFLGVDGLPIAYAIKNAFFFILVLSFNRRLIF